MCQFSRIKLSPAEREEVRKLSGVMIPIYASVALVLCAVVMLAHVPRAEGPIAVAASSSAPAQR